MSKHVFFMENHLSEISKDSLYVQNKCPSIWVTDIKSLMGVTKKLFLYNRFTFYLLVKYTIFKEEFCGNE